MRYFVSRDDIVHIAADEHPCFSAASRHPTVPLIHLAALAGEGLEPIDLTYIDRQIEFLAYLVGRAAGDTDNPLERLAALRRVLAEEEGFGGELEDFDDPSNSSITQLFQRRCGLPLTVSVLYLAVAEQLGWPLVGVDFPLHFLVRYRTESERLLVVDPFHGGRLLDLDGTVALLRPAFGRLSPSHLRSLARMRLQADASRTRIVTRMLRNLESSYLRRREYRSVKNIIQKLLVLDPSGLAELRDLGGVYHLLGDHRRALDCLREYLDDAPSAPDREHVEAVVEHLRDLLEED
jgi:regulator of sirC expression with transglutaminase-like and TPR domain